MTIAPDDLRAAFTEFGNTTTFPDATVQWWLNRAYKMLRVEVWGDDLDDGVMLYVAHNLVIAARNAAAAAAGNISGLGSASGPIASKGVGPVSVSYDTHAGTIEGAGFYNLTSYGVQFYQLVLLYGAGGVQLSGDEGPSLGDREWP